jgi:hypothetical protein
MANTYKNIVITPNIGNTSEPRIQFSGGNTSANTDINLYVYPTTNGTLSFEGSAGQLFSITNDLSNTIFAVNDVSGIPSIEVFANGLVSVAQYSGNVGIGNTTPGHKLSVNGAVAFGNSTITGFVNATTTLAAGNTTVTGFVNATTNVTANAFNVTTAFTANSTVVNAVSYNAGTRIVANTTVVNATHLEGVAAASYVNTSGSYTLSGNLNLTGSNTSINAIFRVVNSSANVLFAGSNGNIGVGNNTPEEKLHVAGAIISSGSTTANKTSAGSFDYSGATVGVRILSWGSVGTNGSITFWSGSGGLGASERMRIDASGNLGIGNAAPTTKLSVNGNTFLGDLVTLRGFTGGTAGSLVSGYNKTLVIGGAYNQTYNAGNSVLIHLSDYDNDTGANVYPIYVEDENNVVDFFLYAGNTGAVGSKIAYVGGNLGVGNTAPTHKLRVEGTASINSTLTVDGVATFNANAVITKLLSANSSFGTTNQFLRTGVTTNTYWGSLTSSDVTTALGYTPGTGSVTSVTAGTGLTSTGTTAVTISMPATGPGAGSYSGGISAITIDAQGRITAITGSAGYSTGDITSVTASTGLTGGGTTGAVSLAVDGTAVLFLNDPGPLTAGLRINGSGLGVNVAVPAAGAITASGDITAFSSDARFKKDIEPIRDALEKLKKITGITYNHNALAKSLGLETGTRMAGVLAQEVEAVLPEVVTLAPLDTDYDEEGNKYSISGENYKTVKYDKMIPLLIEAIKELSDQVDDLKKRLGE